MPVGDINSNEKGSGARYNDGKARLDLIPLQSLVRTISVVPLHPTWALDALLALGDFQAASTDVGALHAAYRRMGYPVDVVREEAAVFEYGAQKYAAWNWAKGMNWSVPIGCFARHAMAVLGGEVNDPESGLPHRGHMACNLRMLMLFVETYPEGNDLPEPGLLSRPAE